MSRLLKNLGIRPSSRRSRVFEAQIVEPAEVAPLLFWAEPAIELRMHLPLEWLRMQGAFAYSGWHPFVEALRHGTGALADFYRAFTPKTLAEMYFLEVKTDS